MFYDFFQLRLFDVKFSFSEKIYLLQAEENGCYGSGDISGDIGDI